MVGKKFMYLFILIFLEYLLHNQFLNSELGYTISISIWLSNSYPQMSMKTVRIKQKKIATIIIKHTLNSIISAIN